MDDIAVYPIPEKDSFGCDRDRDLTAPFYYDGTTYDYISFKVTALDNGQDADVVKQCCVTATPGAVQYLSSSSPIQTGWTYRLGVASVKDVPLFYGPACDE
jgi:hypothetical protein